MLIPIEERIPFKVPDIHPLLKPIFQRMVAWHVPYGEVSKRSGVSVHTIFNMRRGQLPKVANLIAVYGALGLELKPPRMDRGEITHKAKRRFRRSLTCKKGHPRTQGNTYTRPDGYKQCRICHRAATMRSRNKPNTGHYDLTHRPEQGIIGKIPLNPPERRDA